MCRSWKRSLNCCSLELYDQRVWFSLFLGQLVVFILHLMLSSPNLYCPTTQDHVWLHSCIHHERRHCLPTPRWTSMTAIAESTKSYMDRELYSWQIVLSYPPWDLRASTALVVWGGQPYLSIHQWTISVVQYTWRCFWILIDFSNAVVWYSHFRELVCLLTPDSVPLLLHIKSTCFLLEQCPIRVDDVSRKIRWKYKAIIRQWTSSRTTMSARWLDREALP